MQSDTLNLKAHSKKYEKPTTSLDITPFHQAILQSNAINRKANGKA